MSKTEEEGQFMGILLKPSICIVGVVLAAILGIMGWNKYYLHCSYWEIDDEVTIYRRFSDNFLWSVSIIATIFVVALMAESWQELNGYFAIVTRRAIAPMMATAVMAVISISYCMLIFLIAKLTSKCKKEFLKRKIF